VLGSQFSATVCALNCPPLPASAIDIPPALLPIVMEPTALPVAAGANVTFSVAVCPGVNTELASAPLALNPAPFTVTLESVTFALPAFVTVTACELLLPTNTLPKSRLLALAVNSAVAAVALPVAEITSGELGASLFSETEPVTFPAAVGANTIAKVALWPGAMLIGSVRPEVPNPAPATFALEIVTLAVPPFCNAIVCELLAPVVALGKLALIGVAESCGCGVFGGGGVLGGGVPGGCVLGGGVLPPLPEEGLDPMTTPAHPLPTIEMSTAASKHFDLLPASADRDDAQFDGRSAIVRASVETRSTPHYWSTGQTKCGQLTT
jgi:hypothetical protein